jgi:hypothetical protein
MLASGAQCVFWNISPRRSTERTETMADVLKSVIHQALRHSTDLFTHFANQLILTKIHGSHTEHEWVDLVCLLFSKIPNTFVVVETDGLHKSYGEDVDWANRFVQLLQTIVDRSTAAGKCLKILLVGHGTVMKLSLDTPTRGNLLVTSLLPPASLPPRLWHTARRPGPGIKGWKSRTPKFSPTRSRAMYNRCERSAGTVFQLPNPDAIYSRDEGKERRWLPSHVVCVRARSTHC